jgi:ABC-type Na+ transport system ATPase subunit NatA
LEGKKVSEDIIRAEGLTKVFNSHLTAVDHVDFSVKHGEIFGFLGPNGAGKTSRDRENGAFLAVLLSSAKSARRQW